jgi:long-chain acyl-CoA synthetase
MLHPRTHALQTPEKLAYIMEPGGERVTFRQLEERANRCAHLFRDLGLRTGDHIAIFMENHPRYLELTWAAQRAGLYYTPISYRLAVPEIEYIVKDCGAKVFLTSQAKDDLAAELRNRMPNVHTRLMAGGTIPGFDSYEGRAAKYPTTPIADELEGQDILYSSGTTGRPKGIVPPLLGSPLGTIHPAAQAVIAKYGIHTGTVYLSPAPLYHAAPLRFCMWVLRAGGTVIVEEHFDPLEALSLIEKYRVTHSQWVPTMFIRMLKLTEQESKRSDLSSLRVAIHAAAPCPIPVKEQMIQWWGPVIYEYYSSTEGNGFVEINSQDWLKHKGSVGRALVGEVHIMDEDGEKELSMGEIGQIYFANGPPFEYHNDPEKTAAARNSKGWSTVGDIGFVNPEGYVYLTDRKADMIISGGVNIYPQEIENVLILHPKVADVAVFGIPNEEFGEEVKAVVQPANMADAGPQMEQELIAFCSQHLAKFKCPKTVDFERELPRHPTGKLFKRLLKDRYWSAHKGGGGFAVSQKDSGGTRKK